VNQGRRYPWSIATAPVLAVLATACGGGSTYSSETPTGGGGGTALQVTAQNFFFDPKALSAAPGTQVALTFTNSGSVRHSFTAAGANVDAEAGPGDTRNVTFTMPSSGTLNFHCKFHPSMTGTITSSGSAPAPTTQAGTSTSSGYQY